MDRPRLAASAFRQADSQIGRLQQVLAFRSLAQQAFQMDRCQQVRLEAPLESSGLVCRTGRHQEALRADWLAYRKGRGWVQLALESVESADQSLERANRLLVPASSVRESLPQPT